MLAKEIMTKPVIAVSPLTPVKSLAKILIKNNISGVPVLDKRKRLVGIVSEHDLLSKKGSQVKSIVSDKVVGVSEDTPVEEVASLMTTRKVKVAVYTPIYDL